MKIYLVGGAVRDKLLNLPIKERDWVVVGATVNEMLALGYKQVGKEFPVFLHPKTGEEYALARMERKIKPGYQGFTFDTSPNVRLEDDLIRRDLTINAMAETAEGVLIDPYQGKKDLENRLLRHVSQAFIEDPVRILRVGRFLARYASLGFKVAPETILLMRKMIASGEVNALVAERVWKELDRALGEKNPEQFFMVLAECQALPILFPHLSMAGQGIKALIAAASVTPHPMVRFAALCYAQPKDTIIALCQRYRTPNAYRELAVLTHQYYEQALRADTLSAAQLLELFNRLDIFRREERFHFFLSAIDAIAQSLQQAFWPGWLKTAAEVAKSVDVQPLLIEGLSGPELAKKLKIKREETIATWLSKSKKPF